MLIKRARGSGRQGQKRTLPQYYRQVKRRNVSLTRRRTNLSRAVRSIALKNCETKHRFLTAENVQLYHNTPYTNTNLLSTGQSNTQTSRVGDEVIGQYLNLKIWLSNKGDRPNVMYRIVVYSSNLQDTTLYWATGSNGNLMLATADTDKVKILKQRIIKPLAGDYSHESGAIWKEHSNLVSFNIRLKNRKIKYQADAGAVPKWQGNYIHFAVIAYDTYGTLVGDNIASFGWQSCFYFKDP